MKTLKDIDVRGKRVLVRVDFNVPLKNGQVADDERIKAALPTINCLIAQNCSEITLISHLGRPEGKVVPELSLKPIAARLAQLLELEMEPKQVPYAGNKFFFKPSLNSFRELSKITMLENIRFWPEEEANDEKFAQQLAELGEVYIQDAFSCCHRSHASIVGPPKYLPSCAGFLLEKEIKFLKKLLTRPQRPFVVLLGGAKVSDKIGIIKNLSKKADTLLIGGAMAFPFIAADSLRKGFTCKLGKPINKNDVLLAKKVLENAKRKGAKILLPIDVIVAEKIEESAQTLLTDPHDIPDGWQGVDVGPWTIKQWKEEIEKAKTVFWNGPVGIFEIETFGQGTREIAKVVAQVPLSVIGGGETLLAVKKAGVADKITHCSTGGGAALEFLEGRILPGIAALNQKREV